MKKLKRYIQGLKNIEKYREDSEKYHRLFDCDDKELFLVRHEEDLITLQSSFSENYFCVHSYPDDSVCITFKGLTLEAQEYLRKPVEEFFNMEISQEKLGFFRLRKKNA